MNRTNLAAFTDATTTYPGFLSVNREEDGRIVVTARERGHDGTKMVTVEVPPEDLREFASDLLKGLGPKV